MTIMYLPWFKQKLYIYIVIISQGSRNKRNELLCAPIWYIIGEKVSSYKACRCREKNKGFLHTTLPHSNDITSRLCITTFRRFNTCAVLQNHAATTTIRRTSWNRALRVSHEQRTKIALKDSLKLSVRQWLLKYKH